MKYGCHNRPAYQAGQTVLHSKGNASWPWVFKTKPQCPYDMKRTDGKCVGCKWINEGE